MGQQTNDLSNTLDSQQLKLQSKALKQFKEFKMNELSKINNSNSLNHNQSNISTTISTITNNSMIFNRFRSEQVCQNHLIRKVSECSAFSKHQSCLEKNESKGISSFSEYQSQQEDQASQQVLCFKEWKNLWNPGPGAYTTGLGPIQSGSVKFAKRDKMMSQDMIPGPCTYFESGKKDLSQSAAFSFVRKPRKLFSDEVMPQSELASLILSNTGPQPKRRMKGFTFGIGNRAEQVDMSKVQFPGPGFYYTKEGQTTFQNVSPKYTIPIGGSGFQFMLNKI
ncbi:UNKNOWN [Stylonychia lemnae]|uniref:Sperm-tail PG-rich repeat protein n=1 Tax=Stylonychia lemnae TaxID=5949 RepID=A0A078A640_STYLE|nr:UNKNOWN [Stylonychia lemnae]|eukprot:CDW77715.1 UNKNOWN [Stylonychia lemnae]